MRLDADLAIHFHRPNAASAVLERSIEDEYAQRADLLVFCLYASHIIGRLGPIGQTLGNALYQLAGEPNEPDSNPEARAEWIRRLATTLSEIPEDHIPLASLPEEGEARVELVQHEAKGSRRFLARIDAEVNPESADLFERPGISVRSKGFLFGRDLDFFAPASVFVLLTYLVQIHAADETYLARLSKAALAIGVAGSFGTISPQNETAPALGAATTGWFGGVER